MSLSFNHLEMLRKLGMMNWSLETVGQFDSNPGS